MKSNKVKFYVGLDVHKKLTERAVRNRKGDIIEKGSCASNPQDIKQVLKHYLFSCEIGLEPNTEVYPIYEAFKSEGYDIKVANTIQLRTLVGKNDKLDARRLSDMLRLGTFPCSYIPDEKIRSLRNTVKVRHKLLEGTVRLQLQIQAIIRKYGLVMPSGCSFTKRWRTTLQEYISLGKGGSMLHHVYDMYIFTENKLEQVTNEMVAFAKSNFPNEFKALVKRKGIGDTLASYFISEICPVTRFKSDKKLRRYAGVIPCSNQSGEKTYTTSLPKTTSRGILRWALIEASQGMVKFDGNIREYYRKKKKQKKIANKAIMNVARSISDIVYKTLTSCNTQTA